MLQKHSRNIKGLLFAVFMLWAVNLCVMGQELRAKVSINHSKIQGTDVAIFDELQNNLQEFLDNQQWTSMHFLENERIPCSFNITVSEYQKATGMWSCSCMVQANRPVYNSAYTTTFFQFQDNNFTFIYNSFDKLEYNEDMIDNQLTALIGYYAYLIIGLDLETFSPKGGEDTLNRCLNLTNNAQNLNFPGWSSFDKNTNRFTIINDYLENSMEAFRTLQYDYYRKGLDEMANSAERGRTEITKALGDGLNAAHKDRPMSPLPQIWTDFKKDELANIYSGKGTTKEKEAVYDILLSINASQNSVWTKIKE